VYGRTGDVIAQPGDYTAAKVTNAADTTAANTFTNATGQTVRKLTIGTAPNTVTLQVPGTGGAQSLTLPAGTTDFSTSGGTSFVVRQNSVGGALTVSQLDYSDLTGTPPAGAVASVFGRTGIVAASNGDYSASQVTNAADVTAANVFSSATGQSMKQLILPGATSGSLTVKSAAVAGASTLTLPAGSTDFTTTGGVGRVVKQVATGAPLTVGTLDYSELTGTPPAAPVASVFSRTGAVVATNGDYTAAQVTNAADLTAANVFTSATGQTMRRLILGTAPNTLTVLIPAGGGAQTLTLPAATTDFSGTGGPGKVVRQATVGGPFTVSTLDYSEITGVPPSGSVGSVFGRTGTVVAQTGDYTASQVTNAADVTIANIFTSGSGQSMKQLILPGATSGSLTVKSAAVAGSNTLTLPAGTTDLSSTGGPGRLLRQSTAGGAITVATLDYSELTGTPPTGAVASVFGRTGAITAQTGDYTAALVTNAADLTAANVFTSAAGQSMKQLILPGSTSGSLTVKSAAVAGSNTLTLPAGTTDLSSTGGAGRILRQSTAGGAITVATLDYSELTGTPPTGAVSSVFTRTGAVTAASGDYTAAQVTNAADLTAANVFTSATGQTVKQLLLSGATSGTVTLKSPAVSGANTITFPAGTTDFSTSGGASFVVRQNSVGGAFTVSQLSYGDLAGSPPAVNTVGTCVTVTCFSDATPSQRLTLTPMVQPGTPASGKATLYVDSTAKVLELLDDAGIATHTVRSLTPATSQFVTGLSDTGVLSTAQPTKSDVGLGNVDNTSDATKNSAVAVLTNKEIVPRVVQLGTRTTVTPNIDTTDVAYRYDLAVATFVANPIGTPTDQQSLELVFKGATPVAITWDTLYSNECGLALPTGITGDNITYNHFLYSFNSTSGKYCLMATTRAPQNRITTLTSSVNFLCSWDTSDQCQMQMTGASGTLTIKNITVNQNDGDMVVFLFLCTNAQSIVWESNYIASPNVPLPVSCPAGVSTWMMVGLRYSSVLTKTQIVATN